MVEGLTTEDFRELGVNTIGGRARLRAAARDWLQLEGTQEGQPRDGQDTENVVREAGPIVQDAGLEVSREVHEAQEVARAREQGQEVADEESEVYSSLFNDGPMSPLTSSVV